MVRAKNAVNVLMKNFVDMGFGAVAFWMVGYGLMYGTNPTGWFGMDRFFLTDGSDWDFTVLLFQMMFAATAATIVSGALAERVRYWGYIASAVVISSFIYAIFGSWAWGGDETTAGWLRGMGFVDFAGSTVVHSIGGWCALAGVIVLGPRLGKFGADGRPRQIAGHNLPLVALGAMILWVGWFGFNGGSLLEASPKVGRIVLNTHLAGSAGVLGAILMLALSRRSTLMTVSINGGLGGMVAICAGCDLYQPQWAIVVGLLAGAVVTLGMGLLDSFQLDDAVGAVAVHGFAGAWGTLAVGLFGGEQLFDVGQTVVQLGGAVAAFLWAFPISWVVFVLIDKTVGLNAGTLKQQRGLDFTEHEEICYPEFQQDVLHQGRG